MTGASAGLLIPFFMLWALIFTFVGINIISNHRAVERHYRERARRHAE